MPRAPWRSRLSVWPSWPRASSRRRRAAGNGTLPAASAGDAAFTKLADDILQDNFTAASERGDRPRHPHVRRPARRRLAVGAAESSRSALKSFRVSLAAIDAGTLSPEKQLDREQLVHAWTRASSSLDVIRMWTKDPDGYSGGITNAAYVIMKRAYAPAADRLRALIAREKRMPAALVEARKNLENPPQIYTEIAIEQIDGNISFFKNDVPAAFKDVTDKALLDEFAKTNAAVIAALGDYKTLPAEGPAAEVEGQLRLRRRDLRQGARGQRDGRPAARPAAADRRGRPAEERRRVSGDREGDRPEEDGRRGAGLAAERSSGARQAARHDAERARLAPAVHRRSPHRHDSAVGSGAR